MSLIGRLSNKIRAYTPNTLQDLFAHQRISLHKVDPQLLVEHGQAMRTLGHDRVLLPPEDTIAYSHKQHRGTVLPQLQANYNQAVAMVKMNPKELETLQKERIATERSLKRNPYKHQTKLTNLANLDYSIASKIAEKEHLAQNLLVQHRAYYNALHSQTTPLQIEAQAPPHMAAIAPQLTGGESRSNNAVPIVSLPATPIPLLEAGHSLGESDSHSEKIYETILSVKGMTCGGCEKTLTNDLKALPEVKSVRVSHIEGRAVVTHGPDTEPWIFKAAIEKSGKKQTNIRTRMYSKPRETRSASLSIRTESPVADDPAPGEPVDMSGVAASCCGGPALGDLGKAADASNNAATHKYALGGALPSTPLEIGFAGATGYLGAGGALASAKTFRTYHAHARRIKKALGELSDIRSMLGVQSEDLLVLERFLKQQLHDVRFVQYVPGAASGLGSSLIGVGSLLAKFSPPGLMISSLDATMHVVKSTRLRKRYAKALARIPETAQGDASTSTTSSTSSSSSPPLNLAERQAYQVHRALLKQEMTTCALRIAGGTQTALGTAALVPVSLAVYGASIKAAGVPLIAAGVSCLVPGIGLSLRFNPYRDLGIRSEFAKPLTGYRNYLEGLRQNKQALDIPSELAKVSRLFGQEKELEHRLELAKKRKTLSSRYKELYQQHMPKAERIGKTLRTQAIDAASMAVFQLPERSIGRIKRWNKEQLADGSGISAEARLATLDFYSALHDTFDGIPSDTHLVIEGMSVEQRQFNALFRALERDPTLRSGVMKLVAMQALNPQGVLKSDYAQIFQTTAQESSAPPDPDLASEFAKIRSTSPCCLADTSRVFEIMKAQFFRTNGDQHPALTPQQALQRDQLYQRLAHRCDQYIIFGIPRESESDRRVYARYLAQYHARRSEQNQALLLD